MQQKFRLRDFFFCIRFANAFLSNAVEFDTIHTDTSEYANASDDFAIGDAA